jgi:hypothetical protein
VEDFEDLMVAQRQGAVDFADHLLRRRRDHYFGALSVFSVAYIGTQGWSSLRHASGLKG